MSCKSLLLIINLYAIIIICECFSRQYLDGLRKGEDLEDTSGNLVVNITFCIFTYISSYILYNV